MMCSLPRWKMFARSIRVRKTPRVPATAPASVVSASRWMCHRGNQYSSPGGVLRPSRASDRCSEGVGPAPATAGRGSRRAPGGAAGRGVVRTRS
jgi:hypothetical protein